jgi:dihydrofolate reductase
MNPSTDIDMQSTGAVIVGRRTFGFVGGDEPAPGHARYVTEGIASCVAQARAAVGDRDVLLHGAATAQGCLRAGLLDEMELQLVPVLLGQGRRLFENLPPDHVDLELIRTLDGPGVQHLRYRVRSEG